MQEVDLKQIFRIDEKRLLDYYNRIKNQSKTLDDFQIIAKFLENQSIATSRNQIINVLKYYEEKIKPEKIILILHLNGFEQRK